MLKASLLILFIFVLGHTTCSYPTLGKSCISDDNCRHSWEICSQKKSECEHKPLFPMLKLDYIGSIFTFGILTFSNTGGNGGGGIMIPTAIAFFGMDAKNAIALSNVSIFFSGLVRYVFNRNKINP